MGKNEQAQPGEGQPFSVNAGKTSLTKTILEEIVQLGAVPQSGLHSFLCWHKASSGSRRETNRWLDGKWDRFFQKLLASAKLQCACNCGVCWGKGPWWFQRGFLPTAPP